MNEFELMRLEAEDVRPLRTRVLRPHMPEGEAKAFEGDDAESTYHFGLRDDAGEVCAVVTYIREPVPDDLGEPAIRLRGMAVAQESRRQGLGARLLQGTLTRIAVQEPDLAIVWCNARTSAAEFYEREGFERHGEVFEIDRIGPHVVMWREMPAIVAG